MSFTYCGCLFERLYKWRSSYSCLVFCSPRAVSAFASTNLIGLPDDLCFTVGPATSEAARKIGFSPKGSHTGNAEALANYIIENHLQDISTRTVLLLVGAKHSPALPNKLKEAGISHEELIVYNSIPNPDFGNRLRSTLSDRSDHPLCLAFFSPSGVELAQPILKEFLKKESNGAYIRTVAIGPTTAAKLKKLNLPLSGTCKTPTPESLFECVQSLKSSL